MKREMKQQRTKQKTNITTKKSKQRKKEIETLETENQNVHCSIKNVLTIFVWFEHFDAQHSDLHHHMLLFTRDAHQLRALGGMLRNVFISSRHSNRPKMKIRTIDFLNAIEDAFLAHSSIDCTKST